MIQADFQRTLSPYDSAAAKPSRWYFRLHIDPILVGLLTVVIVYGLVVLRSAVDGNEALYTAQIQRYAVAYVVLIVAAQIPPHFYLRISPLVYVVGTLLLLLVLFLASQSKGPSAGLKFQGFFVSNPPS